MFCMYSTNVGLSNFHPLEVVGRGREIQLQVGKRLNIIIYSFKS